MNRWEKKRLEAEMKALAHAETFPCAKRVGLSRMEELWWQQWVKRQRGRESKMKWKKVFEPSAKSYVRGF